MKNKTVFKFAIIISLYCFMQASTFGNMIGVTTGNTNILPGENPNIGIHPDHPNFNPGFSGLQNMRPTNLILIDSNGKVFNHNGNIGTIRPESIINASNIDRMSQENIDKYNFRDNKNEIIIKKDDAVEEIQDLRDKKKPKNLGLTVE